MTVPVTESGFEFKIAEETIWRGRLEHSTETRCTLQPATEQTASELLMCICKPRYTAWLPVIMAYLCLLWCLQHLLLMATLCLTFLNTAPKVYLLGLMCVLCHSLCTGWGCFSLPSAGDGGPVKAWTVKQEYALADCICHGFVRAVDAQQASNKIRARSHFMAQCPAVYTPLCGCLSGMSLWVLTKTRNHYVQEHLF